jgi:glycyl-tRNA synthetase beta chain
MSEQHAAGALESTRDFLLELRSEEIPARMQAGARADLEKLFRKEMDAAGVALGEITVWSTPRRLALIARGLPDATAAVSEEVKGPKVGAPPQALEGFLRKTGLTQDQLTERDGVFFAISEKPGRATKDVLAEAIPAIIRAFPWPKSQRWGADSISTESLRWVRPLSGVVAIFGQDLVACEVGDVSAGCATKGHRFHAPGVITIGGAHDYAEKLRLAHVIVDHAERQDIVRAKAKAAAEAAGLVLVEDEGLVIENAGLTEWPVPLLGRFDEDYLEVPPEVIQLTARTNQKYFICRDAGGKLANAFVCTANIVASDGGEEIVAGNRKVLAARLSDARFFWQQDLKKSLAVHAEGLKRITFHEKLGTVADKVERVAKLARWLVEQHIVTPAKAGAHLPTVAAGEASEMGSRLRGNDEEVMALADQAELAARLCKADLVTEMVGEFPELQGLMGGYYARVEGLPDAVADAIADHYKPVGQGDDVPTAPVTVAVSLADKLDTLSAFFFQEMPPTGSKDPFALRRAALGILSLVQDNRLALPLTSILNFALWNLSFDGLDFSVLNKRIEALNASNPTTESAWGVKGLLNEVHGLRTQAEDDADKARRFVAARSDLLNFFADRLKVQQKEAGVRHDLIDAVFALGGEDDLVRLLARVHALQAFVATPDGTNLLAGYKRAANILKKEGYATSIPRLPGLDPGSRSTSSAEEGSGTPDQVRGDGDDGKLSYTPDPAEATLIAALDAAEPRAEAGVAAEDFTGAMAALATLRSPIDAFFESVTVNDADPAKRAARLGLLHRFVAAVHKVADFSRIEG